MASPKAWWMLKGVTANHGRGRSRGPSSKAGTSSRRREHRLFLEELESRVVLTALITYTAPSTGSNLTLRVAEVAGAADLQLYDNTHATLIQEVVLNQAVQVQITGAAAASDQFAINFSYADGGTAEPIAMTFNGGLPSMNVSDKVTIDGAGTLYIPSSFSLVSNADIVVPGALQAVGNISLTASQQSSGAVTVPGTITANGSANITVNGGSLTGDNITLAAQSTINVNSQSASLFNGLIKAGIVSSTSGANVQVTSGKLTASGSLSLTAASNVITSLVSAPTLAGATDTDAAVSTSNVASTATVAVSGGTLTATAGNAAIAATNTVNVTTSANGAAGGFVPSAKGGTVAVTVLSGDTDATVSGGTVDASGVNVSATGSRTVTTLARATQGGAIPGSPNPTHGQQTLTNYGAKTPDGSVNVAGAVAVTNLSGNTNSGISGGIVTSSSTPLAVSASAANHPTTTADASTASGAAGTGVGVAVAIGHTSANSTASLGGTTSVTAPSVTVTSTMPTTVSGVTPASQFTVLATSGHSGAAVGVAGSLAIDVTSVNASALVQPSSNINLHGASLTLSAQATTNSPASALPEVVSGQSLGVGASLALNVPSASALAAVETGATLAGAKTLSLSAVSNHTATTTALAGAAGGTATAGALSLAIPSGSTTAAIDAGPALALTGGLNVTANRTTTITTQVDSASAASGVALGGSVGLTIANESAAATVGRNVSTGAVAASIEATGNGTSNTTALASTSGAKPGTTVVNTLLGNVGTFAKGQTWIPTTVTLPTAATPDGNFGVAAAIAVNVASLAASAQVLAGTTLHVGGALTVQATNTYTDSAVASATAVSTATDVAAAVAINVSTPTAQSTIAGSVSATTANVIASATGQTGVAADSGQGSSSVGVAGALAVNTPGANSQAEIAAGGSVVLSGLATGAVTVQATTTVNQDNVTANSKAPGFAHTGVGASVSTDIARNGATAEALGNVTSPDQVTIFASGTYNETDTAAAGATGGAALAPALALAVTHNVTLAMVGTAAVISAGGQMLVRALHRDKSNSTASGNTAGTAVALGAAIAIDVGLDNDEAAIDGKVTKSASLNVVSDLGDSGVALGTSSALGAATGGSGISSGIAKVVSFGKSLGWLPSTLTLPAATTPSGPLAVAAAAAVNLDLSSDTATIAAGGSVVTSAPLVVNTLTNLLDSSTANGSPTDGSTVGVGVALAINAAHPSIQASIGGSATAPAISVETEMSGSGTNTFEATATSGAGLTGTGVAGALAINVGASQSTATIGNGAVLTIGGGLLLVQSADVTADLGSALATSTSPGVGFGASVAANGSLNESEASIGSATITGENAISVLANGTHQVTTMSNAGADIPSATAAAAVTVAFSGNQTLAEVQSGTTTLVVPGLLDIDASDATTITTTANGKSVGALAGVGAAVAVGVNREIVTAELARNTNVKSITLQATNVSPTTTTASATSQGGKSLGGLIGAYVSTLITQVDPNAGTPSAVNVPEVENTLTALQNQIGVPLPTLSLAAAVGVSAILPQTLAEIAASAALTSATAVTVQTSVTSNPVTTADGSATGNTVAAHLSVAANYNGGNNQVEVGSGASITAPAITLAAGGPGAQTLTAKAFAGAGAVAGVAASVAVNAGSPTAPNTVQVTIGTGSHLTATTGNVALDATSNVTSVAVSGGAAQGQTAGVGASIGGAFLQEESNVAVAGQVSAPAGSVSLIATGQDTLMGAVIAGNVATGTVDAAVRADILDKTVEAQIDAGGNVSALNDVVVNAISNDSDQAVSTGLGIGAAAVAAAATGVAFNENTWAFITGATVRSDANVLLWADSTSNYDPIAATGSLGLIGAIGVSGTLFYKAENAQAYITGGAAVDALAQGAADTVDTGTETGGVPNTRTIRGVSVTATNFDNFKPLAGAIGGGLIAAAQGSGIVTIINNHVSAYIAGAAKVNQNDAGATANQLVNLLAWDNTTTAALQGTVGAALGVGVSATLDYTLIVKNTQAYIGAGALVSSNTNVEIRANSNETLNSFAGSFNLGGLLSAAAAGSIHTIQDQTLAHTDAGAVITAKGSVLDLASSDTTDNIVAVVGAGGAISGQAMYSKTDIGGATFSAIHIGPLSIGGKPGLTSASVDSQVTAPTLNVSSTSTNTPNVETVLVGAGALNASVAAPTAQTSLETSASLGSAAIIHVTALVGPLANSVNSSTALDLHITAGAITGTAMLPDAVAGGGTSAFVAQGANVTASGLNVQAVATNTATVTPIELSAGAISGSYSNPQASTSQDVEAYIGPAYGTAPNLALTGSINVGAGTVAVNAQSVKNQATINEVDLMAGAITLAYMHPVATIGGWTRAHIGGAFTITASAVNVTGNASNTATTNVISIDASAASVNLNTQGATTSHTTEAYVGTQANLTLVGGALDLLATSNNTATAGEVNIQVAYATVAYAKSEATAGGATNAYVQEGASIHAPGLSVLANATNQATANSFSTTVGEFNVEIAQPTAQTTHSVQAYIGPPDGGTVTPTLHGSINVGSSPITVQATSVSNQATAQQIGLTAAFVTVGVEQPRVTVGGSTSAHVGGNFAITSGGVKVVASAPDNVATGNAISIVAAGVSIPIADRAATTADTTQAYVPANSNLTVTGGSLSLQATSSDSAVSGQVAIGVAGVNISVAKSESNAGGSTSAFVQQGASITATGLSLSAQSTNTAEANPIDVGAAAVKVSVAHPIAETSHTTEVYIGPQGTSAPTSGSSGKISVGAGAVTGTASSTNTATVDPVAVSASGVDVSVLHPEVTAGGSTLSHLGGTFTITAGTVNFTANSTSTATSKSVSVELAGVSVTDDIKSAETDQATSAFVGKQANLTISGASLALNAQSNNTATAGAVAVNISGVPVSLFQPAANADGTTYAYVDQGAQLQAKGLTATATATNNANVSVDLVLAGAVPVTLIQPSATTGDDVQAYVGPASGVAPTSSLTGDINVSGAVTLSATSNDTAQVNATSITFGAVDVTSVRPKITAGGDTLAHLGGNYTISATAVNATASAPNTQATTQTFTLDLGAVNVALASNPVSATHSTESFLAPSANVTVNGGPLTFQATGGNTATASSQDVNIGVVAVASLSAATSVTGTTQAYVGGGAVLKAANVSLVAGSTNNAGATQAGFGLSLLGSVSLNPQATDSQSVQANLAAGSNVTSTGTVSLSATSNDNASASANGTQGAIIGLASVDPSAIANGATTAQVAGTVKAASLSVTATATPDAQANANVISITVAGSANSGSSAQDSGNTAAQLSSTGVLTVTGNVVFQATNDPSTSATSGGGGGGAISGANLASSSTINGSTTAFADNGSTVDLAGTLEFEATSTATGSSTTSVGSGGAFADGGAQASATVAPTIQAYIGNNVQVKTVNGNIVIQAQSDRAEGDASAQTDGGGVAYNGASNANVTSDPTVNAYIGTGSAVNAAGNVTITAESEAQPTGPALGNTFNPATAVSLTNDTITFPSHGLVTGDVVTYSANGSTPIGTPGGPLRNGEFGVIDVDSNVLMLGATFTGAPANTGAVFNPQNGVDPNRAVIRFASPDNFQTGDAVKYNAEGNALISSAINQTGAYYVRVIDPNTIELFSTLAEAEAPAKQFDPSAAGAVSGPTITLPGHGFTNGEAITYSAPAPAAFGSAGVDVDINSSHQISGNDTSANNIYLGSENGSTVIEPDNFVTGEKVTYEVEPTKTALGGLTNGGTYWIIQDGGYAVQLASSYANALADKPITLTPDKSTSGEAVTHELVPAPIGGLTSGYVYYVRNATANTFQLSATPTGAIIALNVDSPADIKGEHSFHQAGIQYNSTSTGTQDLYIDFSSNAAGNDELLGPGGVSLRTISPPSGTGISASSADGGEGGFAAKGSPNAQTNVTANVAAYVAARQLTAGGNVSITTLSTANSSSQANNGGGGVFFGGSANAGTSFQNNNSAYVGVLSGSSVNGTGVQITAGGNFQMNAVSSLQNTYVNSSSNGGGLVSSTNATSSANLGGTTQTVVGDNASVQAQTVSMLADYTSAQGTINASTTAGGLFGSATANTNGTWNPSVLAEIAPGGTSTVLTGTEGVDMRALSQNINFAQNPNGTFYGIGSGNSNRNLTNSLSAQVVAGTGATVTAGPRILPGPGVPASYVTPLQQPSGFSLLALYVDADVDSTYTSATRQVEWNSNVIILSGPNPDLLIDANGNIVRAINISVNGGQKTGTVNGFVSVDPITNNDRGQVLFQTDNSGNSVVATSLPTGPLFTFRETFQTVSIVDESSNLVLNDINVVNTTPLEPGNQVTLNANSVSGFQFNVNHDFKPTTITVQDSGQNSDIDYRIFIDGTINNPIGITNITDLSGDIFAQQASETLAAGVIITDSFAIAATNGNIGYDQGSLQLDVVDSNDGPTNPADQFRTVDAAYDVFLQIQGLYREGAPGSVPPNGYTTHIDRIKGGDDVNVVLQGPVIQNTITSFNYYVQVGETSAVHSPDSPNPMDVVSHFRPSTPGSTPTVLPTGIFGTTTEFGNYEDYDFGSATDTNTGIIAGNDAQIGYYDQQFIVSGYAHVGGTLTQLVYGSLTQR